MAPNKMEFVGNDRYFKYRYAQETAINVTTIKETYEMENQVLRYKIVEEYIGRTLNMKLVFRDHEVDFIDASKIYTEPNNFNNSSILFIPASLSFFRGRQEHFSPSPVYETVKTIIISAPPKRLVSTSLSFLNMDAQAVILTLSTVVILSLLLVIYSIATNKYKSLPTKKVVKKLAQETLRNVWDNASLLCAEPIPAILPHITCRLLASSWLIGVTFILFFLGCFLRTDFTTESYNSIDTLADLINSGVPPTMIEGTGTLDNLKYLAAQDQVVKEWLDSFDEKNILSSPMEYLLRDGFIPILSGKRALITADSFLLWFLGQLLISDDEAKEIFTNKGGFYFSQQEIDFDHIYAIFNTSWMNSSPQLHETSQLIMEPLFETKVLNHLDLKMHHLIDKVTWKRPLKSTADLDLSSVSVPFCLLFILMSGTAVVVIIEIVFKNFA